MKTLPLLRLVDGFHNSPMEAGPDHHADAVNFFSDDGHLKKRMGCAPRRVLVGSSSTPRCGVAAGTGEPSATSTVVEQTFTPGPTYSVSIYAGLATKFNLIHMVGKGWFTDSGSDLGYGTDTGRSVQYWNGTAWTTLLCRELKTPVYNASADTAWIAPYFGYRPKITAAASLSHEQSILVFDPPADWATKSIAASTQYWIRLTGVACAAGIDYSIAPVSSWVQTTENRVLHLNYFNDRTGAPHEFAVQLFGADGKNLRFIFDGQVLAQSDGLQPDGASKMFGPTTRVYSHYHPATNRVIGHVSGLGWFYIIPYTNTATGAGYAYSFAPDSVGVDTPYEGLIGGLRSVMPAATCSVLHDGRIFACEGQYVRWSAPGPYADIWPNDNEALIADAYGNITGLAQVGGVLVVFKRNSIWVGQPSGEDEGYTFYPVPGSVGCCAPKSIATTGNVVVFLAEDGFYTFDGQTVKKISSQLGKLIEDGWASTVENGQAVFASAYNHYRFFYSDTGSSTCLDSALYCDLGQETPSWWRQKPTSGFAATALAVDTTSDVNQMVFGDKYGVIWDADTGIADRIDQWVTASLDTHRLGLGSAQKAIFRWASPTTENDGNFDWYVGLWPDGDSTARVDHLVNKYNGLTATGEVFLDGETFTDTGTFVEAPSHAIGQCSFAAAGRWFQLRLSHDKPSGFVLEAIECEVVPTGKRGAR